MYYYLFIDAVVYSTQLNYVGEGDGDGNGNGGSKQVQSYILFILNIFIFVI